MGKGDWEVEEPREDCAETPTDELTSCQMYGHSYEDQKDDNGVPLVGPDGDVLRRCNDCAEVYESDPPEDDTVCVNGDGDEYPEHDFPSVGECRRCGAEAGE
jgi:hypothetical protein